MKCYGIANLVNDPRLIETKSGAFLVKLRLAFNTTLQSVDRDGNKLRETFYTNAQAWDSAATLIANNFKQGDRIFIEGRMRTEEYLDKEGKTRRDNVLRIEQYGAPVLIKKVSATKELAPAGNFEEPEVNDTPF